MIKLLKCELLKMRHRYVFLSALAIVAAGLVFSLYGNYRGTIADFIMKNGWVISSRWQTGYFSLLWQR
mgnify:CR=1 FL=1